MVSISSSLADRNRFDPQVLHSVSAKEPRWCGRAVSALAYTAEHNSIRHLPGHTMALWHIFQLANLQTHSNSVLAFLRVVSTRRSLHSLCLSRGFSHVNWCIADTSDSATGKSDTTKSHKYVQDNQNGKQPMSVLGHD